MRAATGDGGATGLTCSPQARRDRVQQCGKVEDILTRARACSEEIQGRTRGRPARETSQRETRHRTMRAPMKLQAWDTRLFAVVLGLVCGGIVAAQTAEKKAEPASQAKASQPSKALPKPTLANVPYGAHERQVLDFYRAESARPTPLVFFIH